MLRGILHAFFGLNIHNIVVYAREYDDFLASYFDPFCGAGTYNGEDDDEAMLSEDSCDYGSPIVAIDACLDILLERVKSYEKRLEEPAAGMVASREKGISGKPPPRLIRLARFFFSDSKRAYVDRLRSAVSERVTGRWGGRRLDAGGDSSSSLYAISHDVCGADFVIEVTLLCKDFLKLPYDLGLLPAPLFSFVDPFGMRVPFDKVCRLLSAYGSFLFLNLMVEAINRWASTRPDLIDAIYGCAGWRDIFEEAGEGPGGGGEERTAWVNAKLRRLADFYCERLQRACEGKRTALFALRRGKTHPDKGTIFYMVFACDGLTVLQQMKMSMQRFVQRSPVDSPEYLCYSDFYHHRGMDVGTGRKSTDEQEADVIYEHFKGQCVRLGDIKAFVLCKTPFPYHARAMRALEKKGKVKVEDFGERKGKEFKCKVPFSEHSRQEGNHWLITFAPPAKHEGEMKNMEAVDEEEVKGTDEKEEENEIKKEPEEEKEVSCFSFSSGVTSAPSSRSALALTSAAAPRPHASFKEEERKPPRMLQPSVAAQFPERKKNDTKMLGFRR